MPQDNINPDHYKQLKDGLGVECIDVIEALNLNFHTGNAMKYLWRFGQKGGFEDLKKAAWYLNRYIEWMESYEQALQEPGVPPEAFVQKDFLDAFRSQHRHPSGREVPDWGTLPATSTGITPENIYAEETSDGNSANNAN